MTRAKLIDHFCFAIMRHMIILGVLILSDIL